VVNCSCKQPTAHQLGCDCLQDSNYGLVFVLVHVHGLIMLLRCFAELVLTLCLCLLPFPFMRGAGAAAS
jgi:hypothetical protein